METGEFIPEDAFQKRPITPNDGQLVPKLVPPKYITVMRGYVSDTGINGREVRREVYIRGELDPTQDFSDVNRY